MKKQNYETLFILDPILDDQQTSALVGKFIDFLNNHDASIVTENKIGLKKLAYPIQSKASGYYCVIEFVSSPGLVSLLEIEYKREERVLRFLTIVLDKHGVSYNESKRANLVAEKK